ncbi:hypothetical protein FSP39_002751 [Pinctada imbricata]|uniref:Angiotensin-converting enzyme n=1 Tax=Pinctada imbricata TaxID=66713 RepID=A0AA88YRW9_PINIB|nr:hypothetical protein FSP39_002751 [Pinctada imbricata]
MFSMGKSRPWPDVLEMVTGKRYMDVTPTKEYFQTLIDWLQEQNKGKEKGWVDGCPSPSSGLIEDEEAAIKWLDIYNREARKAHNKQAIAYWNHNTNMTDYNQNLAVQSSLEMSDFNKRKAREASAFDWRNFSDSSIRREFSTITDIGVDALEDKDKIKQINALEVEMGDIYSTAEVCNVTGNECVTMEKGLADMMSKSRNYTQLLMGWKAWRDATGRKLKDKYDAFVKLLNEGIQSMGVYKDAGERRKASYEVPTFEEDIKNLLEELSPLYTELHTYVREKLQAFYKDYEFPKSGHIPAHILGNMWAQDWNSLSDILQPFPNAPSVDVTPQLKAQNYTAQRMYETAEEFFTSLGFPNMTKEFWENSMLEQPEDGRKVVCHASAWDFYTGTDFRIKMCTNINMNDFLTVHHEMGHVVYDMAYAHQPVSFMDGANPGFHEAIGDIMTLSVATPKHLHKIGLLQELEDNQETSFFKHVFPEKIEKIFPQVRCKYQGIYPAVERTEEDFDPGAKYHIPDDTPYIRYFISTVIQFQFHKALCNAAGHVGPLNKCDIYQSKAAGNLLRRGLSLGASKPWPDAMEVITGQRKMDVGPMKEYFEPLIRWLKEQNQGKHKGWIDSCPSTRAILLLLMQGSVQESVELSDFNKKKAREASAFDWRNFSSSSIRREFSTITDIGVDALEDKDKIKQINALEVEMEEIYSRALVCNVTGNECITMETGLADMITTSRNYTQLLMGWKAWRDATGKKLKDKYKTFVKLLNEGIQTMGVYKDAGERRKSWYEVPTFEEDIKNLLEELSPLYTELHTYVREKLQAFYKDYEFPKSGHIPAHILGNMWSQVWHNILDIVQPFPDAPIVDVTPQLRAQVSIVVLDIVQPIVDVTPQLRAQVSIVVLDIVQPFPDAPIEDVTPELRAQNYTPRRMYEMSEEFFVSMGFSNMTKEFWENSMLEQPDDGRKVVCHASAWDLYTGTDFRIKMCTNVNMNDLVVVHHEMGHIVYDMEYAHQPVSFMNSANNGFHEAIGDLIALSVVTPIHLHKIGLLDKVVDNQETDINFLMKMALEKIAFLPFGYLIDQWRWSVFRGDTTEDQYNKHWWDLRCKYQGIYPAIKRTEEDFDPGAKWHIPGDTPYIRYFISYVIQFQFHKALCNAAGHIGPLHKCDIYQSKAAGDLLRKAMSLGASKPWPDAMQVITGQRKMDVGPMKEYFEPLIQWLKEQNQGKQKGWTDQCPRKEGISNNTRLQHPQQNPKTPMQKTQNRYPQKETQKGEGTPTHNIET